MCKCLVHAADPRAVFAAQERVVLEEFQSILYKIIDTARKKAAFDEESPPGDENAPEPQSNEDNDGQAQHKDRIGEDLEVCRYSCED